MTVLTAPARRLKRRRRVRAKIVWTATRPRISVFRSNRGLFAQLIDDESGRTLASAQWTESAVRDLKPMEGATKVGSLIAERRSSVYFKRIWMSSPAPPSGAGTSVQDSM